MTEERTLVQKCKAGDPDALEELYDRYAGQLLAVCVRYSGDRAASEDVLHDAFIKIYDGIGRFSYRGEGSLKAWMKRIAVNLQIDRLRASKTVPLLERIDFQDNDRGSRALPDELSTEDFDESEIKGIPLETLLKMIGSLPEPYRTVFNMFCLDGYSHKEIADKLGISANVSSTQYFRARKMLAEMMGRYLKDKL